MHILDVLKSKWSLLKSKLSVLKNINRNTILIGIAIIAIVITGVLIFAKSNTGFSLPNIFGMSDQQVGQKAIDYINNNQLSDTPASLVSASEESGLVKIKIKIGDNEFDSYVTKDAKFLFPAGNGVPFDMSVSNDNSSATSNPAQTADEIIAAIQKSDKPVIDAFVVSSCPFGLQMQRMVVDAVKNIPSLAQYITVRYMGSISNGNIYSMHDADASGKTIANGPEAMENLRQICIREEQPAKFYNYLSCYMQKQSGAIPNGMPLGDSTGCQITAGVNTSGLNACVSDHSRGFAYAQKDFDLSAQYNVSGSPTLIVNGATTEEFTSDNQPVFGSSRSSDEVKTVVCDGFNNQPGFCSTELSTDRAATSFSATYVSVSGAADANSNCATAQ